MQQFESFTKMIMATTTDPVAIQVGNGARIRISDERGNNLFIQKYMLLNTDKASTDFLLLNVLDLKWTVMGETGRSKRLKLDVLREWTVLKL